MSTIKSLNENKIDFDSVGREAIQRLVFAYGLSTRQALVNHLHVSKSTLVNNYLRETFLADFIIQVSSKLESHFFGFLRV
ncbi:TPA: bacteriophage CI repressor [Enterobacter cloacae subsp. cloacae]|nr:bacteriophage CI repressor [Enterobacter cloacae subsp. cloacae]